MPANIEILAPGGEPSRRDQRVVIEGCRALDAPIDLQGKDWRAAMDRLVEHVDRSTMLCSVCLATPFAVDPRPSAPEDSQGRLIDARVLRTERPTARVLERLFAAVTVRSINEWPS